MNTSFHFGCNRQRRGQQEDKLAVVTARYKHHYPTNNLVCPTNTAAPIIFMRLCHVVVESSKKIRNNLSSTEIKTDSTTTTMNDYNDDQEEDIAFEIIIVQEENQKPYEKEGEEERKDLIGNQKTLIKEQQQQQQHQEQQHSNTKTIDTAKNTKLGTRRLTPKYPGQPQGKKWIIKYLPKKQKKIMIGTIRGLFHNTTTANHNKIPKEICCVVPTEEQRSSMLPRLWEEDKDIVQGSTKSNQRYGTVQKRYIWKSRRNDHFAIPLDPALHCHWKHTTFYEWQRHLSRYHHHQQPPLLPQEFDDSHDYHLQQQQQQQQHKNKHNNGKLINNDNGRQIITKNPLAASVAISCDLLDDRKHTTANYFFLQQITDNNGDPTTTISNTYTHGKGYLACKVISIGSGFVATNFAKCVVMTKNRLFMTNLRNTQLLETSAKWKTMSMQPEQEDADTPKKLETTVLELEITIFSSSKEKVIGIDHGRVLLKVKSLGSGFVGNSTFDWSC